MDLSAAWFLALGSVVLPGRRVPNQPCVRGHDPHRLRPACPCRCPRPSTTPSRRAWAWPSATRWPCRWARGVMRGVVVALREGAGGNRPLKPVLERLDDPPLPPGALTFIEWAGALLRSTPPASPWPWPCAACAIRPPSRDKVAGRHRRRAGRADAGPSEGAGRRRRAGRWPPADLARAAGVSAERGQGPGRRGRAGRQADRAEAAASRSPTCRGRRPDAQPQPGGAPADVLAADGWGKAASRPPCWTG